jgi:speckle-type POZ protein
MASTGCGCSSELSQSASSIAADTARGYHILKIDDYSLTKGTPTGEYLKSHPFTVGGHHWQIRYYPNGFKSEHADFISIYLQHDGSVASLVKAQYEFRFVDNVGEEPVTLQEVTSFASNVGWGYSEFIKREKLEKSMHLKDDSFSVRCDIVVVNEFRAAMESPPRFVSVPPSDLHQYLGDLLRSEKGADVVFDVGGQTFAAHRCVLAARSPVFSAELFGTMKESNTTDVVRVDDMEARVFKALLYFVYTDSLPKTEEAGEGEKREETEEEEDDIMSQHLLVAADRYNLERLKLICEEKLCGYIDVGTVDTQSDVTM